MKTYMALIIMTLALLISCGKKNKTPEAPSHHNHGHNTNHDNSSNSNHDYSGDIYNYYGNSGNGANSTWRLPDVIRNGVVTRVYITFNDYSISNTSVCYSGGLFTTTETVSVSSSGRFVENTVYIEENNSAQGHGCYAAIRKGHFSYTISGDIIEIRYDNGDIQTGYYENSAYDTYIYYPYNYNNYHSGAIQYSVGISAYFWISL